MCSKIATLSGAALFTCVTALALMNPGSTPPTQQPTNPATNSRMNSADEMQQQQQGSASSVMQDKEFVRKALEGGMAEVQLGQLAAEKGTSDDVKQFGQKMVTDHTKLGDQMKVVAQQIGVTPPARLSKKDEELKTRLQGLSETQFDEAYIKAMVKDHKQDAEEFTSEAQQSQNPTVKEAAQQGSQVIDEHLQMIQQIAQSHHAMNKKSDTTTSASAR